MKKKMICVLDTETCPIENLNTVNASNMLTYDLGYSIVDLHGNVYCERSFVIADVFFGEEEKMLSAYYVDKLPQYRKDIASGKRLVRTWKEIKWYIQRDFEKYNVKTVCAHNARFDYYTLKATRGYLKEDYLLPYGIEWYDTMKMVQTSIATKKSYVKFCENNNYITKLGKPQVKAEVVYRYITGKNDFIESHTGLEDVQIEREILWACLKMHKKMTRKLWK